MVGPLKTAVGGYNYIFVAIDKFTKWIDVKPVTATTTAKAVEFIAEISHRFRVPNRIITDLGTSFSCIDIYYASVVHPSAMAKSKGPMA